VRADGAVHVVDEVDEHVRRGGEAVLLCVLHEFGALGLRVRGRVLVGGDVELWSAEQWGELVDQVTGELACLGLGDVEGRTGHGRTGEAELGPGPDRRGGVGRHLDLGNDVHVVPMGCRLELAEVGLRVRLGSRQVGVLVADEPERVVVAEVQLQRVQVQIPELPDRLQDVVRRPVLPADVEQVSALTELRPVTCLSVRQGAVAGSCTQDLQHGLRAVEDAGVAASAKLDMVADVEYISLRIDLGALAGQQDVAVRGLRAFGDPQVETGDRGDVAVELVCLVAEAGGADDDPRLRVDSEHTCGTRPLPQGRHQRRRGVRPGGRRSGRGGPCRSENHRYQGDHDGEHTHQEHLLRGQAMSRPDANTAALCAQVLTTRDFKLDCATTWIQRTPFVTMERREKPQATASLTLWIPTLSLGFKKGSPRRKGGAHSKRPSGPPLVTKELTPVGGPAYTLTHDARRSTQEKKTRQHRCRTTW
jgi:hypothetical protein